MVIKNYKIAIIYDLTHTQYQNEKFMGKLTLKNKHFNYIFMVGHFYDSI